MKTNKMLPDASLSKVWENFRKMSGIILTFLSSNWVAQSDGTFTNTVEYEGFTSKEILEVDLYDDGNLTETQISEYDGYITAFNINDGEIVAVASTQPTTNITVLCRGEIVGSGNGSGGGSGSLKITKMTQAAFKALPKSQQQSGIYIITDAEGMSAKNIVCKDANGNNSNVQTVLDEQNKNFEWKLAGTVVGRTRINVPSNFNELLVNIKGTTYSYSVTFIKNQLSTSETPYIMGYGASSLNSYCILHVSTTSIFVYAMQEDSKTIHDNVELSVYYR